MTTKTVQKAATLREIGRRLSGESNVEIRVGGRTPEASFTAWQSKQERARSLTAPMTPSQWVEFSGTAHLETLPLNDPGNQERIDPATKCPHGQYRADACFLCNDVRYDLGYQVTSETLLEKKEVYCETCAAKGRTFCGCKIYRRTKWVGEDDGGQNVAVRPDENTTPVPLQAHVLGPRRDKRFRNLWTYTGYDLAIAAEYRVRLEVGNLEPRRLFPTKSICSNHTHVPVEKGGCRYPLSHGHPTTDSIPAGPIKAWYDYAAIPTPRSAAKPRVDFNVVKVWGAIFPDKFTPLGSPDALPTFSSLYRGLPLRTVLLGPHEVDDARSVPTTRTKLIELRSGDGTFGGLVADGTIETLEPCCTFGFRKEAVLPATTRVLLPFLQRFGRETVALLPPQFVSTRARAGRDLNLGDRSIAKVRATSKLKVKDAAVQWGVSERTARRRLAEQREDKPLGGTSDLIAARARMGISAALRGLYNNCWGDWSRKNTWALAYDGTPGGRVPAMEGTRLWVNSACPLVCVLPYRRVVVTPSENHFEVDRWVWVPVEK